MKRSTIITIAVSVWIAALVGMILGVDAFVKAKDRRLFKEARDNISALFDDNKYIDVNYSGRKVSYEKAKIPSKANVKDISFDWNNYFGDIVSFYKIDVQTGTWSEHLESDNGWELVKLEYYFNGYTCGIAEDYYFPYAVGYKKLDYSWERQYVPSVNKAVSEAFEFFTKDPESNFKADKTFEIGSRNKIMRKARNCENEYYCLKKDSYAAFQHGGSGFFGDFDTKSGVPYTYMYNGYYKVFVGLSHPNTYTITKRDSKPDEKEKTKLMLIWSIILTVIMLGIVIPVSIVDNKRKAVLQESLYEKLLRLCNPANYLKQYDREKVDKANSLYQRLLAIDPNDAEGIKAIETEAVSGLGISLIDAEILKELKELVNPKKFLKPYDAEKFARANELYSKLLKEDLSFDELMEIEAAAKELS